MPGTGTRPRRARLVGINHVALEVADVARAARLPRHAVRSPPRDRAQAAAFVDNRRSVPILPSRRLDFLDPDGDRVDVVQYDQIQFTKPAWILRGRGRRSGETDDALAELGEKGLA